LRGRSARHPASDAARRDEEARHPVACGRASPPIVSSAVALGRRSLWPSARWERSSTRCSETFSSHADARRGSIFVSTMLGTIRSSLGRRRLRRRLGSAPSSERKGKGHGRRHGGDSDGGSAARGLQTRRWPKQDRFWPAADLSGSSPPLTVASVHPGWGRGSRRNADATRYAIAVNWDGKWSGKAAMWDHLRVEPPRKGR
jgi:hypothetical protein